MIHESGDDDAKEFSSPACSMHEASDSYMGRRPAVPVRADTPPASAGWEEVRRWRKQLRDALIQRRASLSADARRVSGERACTRLSQAVDLRAFRVLGFCWPIRGEFDLRAIAKQHLESGGEVALPVVVQRSAPLEFWRWFPGMPMQSGIWNIPIPKKREPLSPDAVIAPLVGFDRLGYRLGYGGGYFDRTLAAASPRPYAIGIGYAESALDTIRPQPHDIPMSMIVTEAETLDFPASRAGGE